MSFKLKYQGTKFGISKHRIMNSIIESSLKRSISYQTYRELVEQMARENKTSGLDKTKTQIKFTKLNDSRMRRWDKRLKIADEYKSIIKTFDEPIIWLVMSESWCGDSAHVLPVLNKIAELNNHIDLKIVFRDNNPELMDSFLTYGNRAVPKLIMIDKASGDILTTYGPRPSEATDYVHRFKAKYGKLTPEFKADLQHWYNNDKGQNIVEDVVRILCELEPMFANKEKSNRSYLRFL